MGRALAMAFSAAGERLALRDQLRREASRRGRQNRSDRRPPSQRDESQDAETSERDRGNKEFPEHGNPPNGPTAAPMFVTVHIADAGAPSDAALSQEERTP